MTRNRVQIFILGGGKEGLEEARRRGAIHIDQYAQPDVTEGVVKIHVQNKELALLFLDNADEIYVYPDFAELLPKLPREKTTVIAPPTHPLCVEYRCL
ncbi:MAG: hypothetical protein ACK4SY_10080 [Pyrobaculum sp.]